MMQNGKRNTHTFSDLGRCLIVSSIRLVEEGVDVLELDDKKNKFVSNHFK